MQYPGNTVGRSAVTGFSPPKTRDANEPRELVWVSCHPKRFSGALFRTMGLGNGHLKRLPYEAQVCYKVCPLYASLSGN